MAKIQWEKYYKDIFESLHTGQSVKDTAAKINVSYGSLCKFLNSTSLNNKGKFKSPLKFNEELRALFVSFILKENDQISFICEKYGCTQSQLQNMLKKYDCTKEWNLSESTSINVARGRKAEILIKEMPDFIVIADKIKTDSKSPYDLILRPNQEVFNNWNSLDQIGAIDVKATHLRPTESKTRRFKWNVHNVTKPTKFVFLIGYDESYEIPLVLLILPYKIAKGKSSISVSYEKLMESKYKDYVYKLWEPIPILE